MSQEKLDSFMVETLVSNVPEIIKSVSKAYEGLLKDYAKWDCNVVYYGGKIVGSIEGHHEPDNYADQEEHVTYCGEIAQQIYDHIKEKFGNVSLIAEGHFLGEGAKYSPDKKGDHVWVMLEDGTIIDGAYKQYQDPSMKRRKRIRFVKPTDPEYQEYGFTGSQLNSTYDEQLHMENHLTRIKIPIEHMRISNKVNTMSIQCGKDRMYYEHGCEGRLIKDSIIDPIASHRHWKAIRDIEDWGKWAGRVFK